ncbi:MAG: bifunctional methylenetetrahydrofolate dehydrogenase/methenyltetrahydrofolate cyclohydrolase FolD [Bdellovibrionales bacterium]|nr:bifunctional methylenetetrahydrofolate dehydrogenase/methenyltetrahydrofolate cyclohydrolase FolD [Bdellovibrionales bacterium]
MELINGKELSQELRADLKKRVENFTEKTGLGVCLAVVLVGEDPASQVYVRNKIKACEQAGIKSLETRLAATTSEAELLQVVEGLNVDPQVNGILVQLPLPKGLNEDKITDAISPLKDADGLVTENLGLLVAGRTRVAACTPSGVIELLKKHKIPIQGANAVVVGRSQIVGKPMALLLLEQNATVTICHSRTKDLRKHLHEADIVVVAAGQPEFLGADDFKEGTVIIDVGMHRRADGKLCGDVRFDELKNKAKAMTPVPGGVGPMTIAMLLENTLKLAELQASGGHHE